MSLSDFVSWLFARIVYVLDWFGSSYNDLRNGAANALRWAIDQATNAYNRAVEWAYNEVRNAYYSIRDYAVYLYNQAIDYALSVRSYLIDLYGNVRSYALSLVSEVWRGLDAIVTGIHNDIDRVIRDVITYLTGVINGLLDGVYNDLGWIITQRNKLLNVLSLLSGNNLTILSDLLTRVYNNVLVFTQNPVGYLLGILWSPMLTYLSYLIGYALGSTQDDLPPVPDWTRYNHD